jgi:hypothetical protein
MPNPEGINQYSGGGGPASSNAHPDHGKGGSGNTMAQAHVRAQARAVNDTHTAQLQARRAGIGPSSNAYPKK